LKVFVSYIHTQKTIILSFVSAIKRSLRTVQMKELLGRTLMCLIR